MASDLDESCIIFITDRAVEDGIAKSLLNIENLGNEQHKKFIEECSVDKQKFEKPIKQNKILNFSSLMPKKKNWCSW